jgi:flavin-dependent dehydrogenase
VTGHVDVCVIGAGPAGACAAASAARHGASVLLVDPFRPARRGLELLSGRTGPALAGLGVLDDVLRTSTASTGTVARWGTADFLEHPAVLDPWGGGWIVDRTTLDGLFVHCALASGVRPVIARATRLAPDGGATVVAIGNAETVRAEVVVVATGRPAALRGAVGPAAVGRRIVALVADLGPAAVPDLGTRLLVDRDADGWWYGLATPERTTVGYCSDGDLVGHGRAGVGATWRNACARADWLPPAVAGETPRVRSRTTGTAAVPGRGVRLVGDAALSVDPLSGHGLALAVEGGVRWAEPHLPAWLAAAAKAHADQERVVYAAAAHQDGPFWRRRR